MESIADGKGKKESQTLGPCSSMEGVDMLDIACHLWQPQPSHCHYFTLRFWEYYFFLKYKLIRHITYLIKYILFYIKFTIFYM